MCILLKNAMKNAALDEINHLIVQVALSKSADISNVRCRTPKLRSADNHLKRMMAAPMIIQLNHLVKSFVANVALECLLTRMGQSVVLVIAFLVKSFSTIFAYERFVA